MRPRPWLCSWAESSVRALALPAFGFPPISAIMLYPQYKSNETPRVPFVQKYQTWLLLGAIVVLGVITAVVIRMGLQAGPPPTPQRVTPALAPAAKANAKQLTQDALTEALPGLAQPVHASPRATWAWFTPALAAHCRELLHAYHEASAWSSKLPLVRDASRVEPLMRTYYEQDHLKDPESREPVTLEPCLIQNHPVIRALFTNSRSDLGTPLEAALVADRDGVYRLDWESFVGAGEMSWAAFRAQRPTHPVLLRGCATADTYFNYEFADQTKYVSYRIYSPDGTLSVNAFCAKETQTAQAIESPAILNPQTFLMPVTVRLVYPPQAKSDHCTALVEIVAKGWLLP